MPTAILIDGAYFVKRFRRIEPHNFWNAARAAECAHRWAVAHLSQGRGLPRRELYRIFFYDCPPLGNKLHHPLTKRAVDFGKSDEAAFRLELHKHLRVKRKVALRFGHLSKQVRWTIKPDAIEKLLKGALAFDDLEATHVVPDARQKGVDMRIGIDVTTLALKKRVDQIILMAGDADFIPAAKQARREGVDFVLDPLWANIPDGLQEHVDGLRTTCPRPSTAVRGSRGLIDGDG
ncbi:NYN domain-containing protein [Luteibacter aegosomaticola]|uniref:NYN domain-containing protein n=1 Tax=Luteibacter aegosomaticola TaxID=2911538 RepID=UPI001FFA2BAD|nr:NYN domain-containing protein [Luteibacter aegosomaticola]UPG90384.1 NYN domain-containing protein [Luteibacter aegosomaticola]